MMVSTPASGRGRVPPPLSGRHCFRYFDASLLACLLACLAHEVIIKIRELFTLGSARFWRCPSPALGLSRQHGRPVTTNTIGVPSLDVLYRMMAATETETTSSSDCNTNKAMASSRASGSSIDNNCSTSRGAAHAQNDKDPHPSSAGRRPLYEAPPHTGLLITLQENGGKGNAGHSSSLLLTFVPDLSLKTIHPNAHGPASPPIVPMSHDADTINSSSTDKSDNKEGSIPNSARVPASLSDVHLLMGGGSGATVFSGSINHYGLGHVVMKHGGPKETAEHVALATIEEELRKRGRKATQSSSDLDECGGNDGKAAAEFFRTRIPTFSFLYISPWHCRDRGAELWSTLRNLFLMHKAMKGLGWWENLEGKDNLQVTTAVGGKKTERTVRVFSRDDADTAMPKVEVSNGFVDLHLPGAELITPQTAMTPAIVRFGQSTEGYTNLYNLSKQLRALQEERLWKFTQGQSEIGGDSPRTASSLLTSCQLCANDGRLLHVLTDEFIQVIRNLQILTHPEELDAIQDVEEELMTLEGAASNDGTNSNPRIIAAVSKKTDMFVGLSIKKNYHPTAGRFVRMRKTGEKFRHYFDEMQKFHEVNGGSQVAGDPNDKRFVLTDEEKVPARFLAKLLEKGTPLREIFDADVVKENQRCALDVVTDNGHSSWLGLIRRAVSVQCDSARKCVWNAGLSDAGLHNLFLDGSKLWLFDLGPPAIQPVPAFLTKFLMSFFHCLGMEDVQAEAEDLQQDWVRRFNVDDNKLRLTSDTEEILVKVYEAFDFVLGMLDGEIFDGEQAVRDLTLRYVVLQLLSDASFCLERWKSKGGGSDREGNHHQRLEKWLWRSLWDLYIASDVVDRLIKDGKWV